MFYKTIVAAAFFAFGSQGATAQQFNGGLPAGWTCVGNCGTSGANGVVTAPPKAGSTQYGWVSSAGGSYGVAPYGLGGETDGSKLTSTAFTAKAGDVLEFDFNYVTSDGSGFADYGWAHLLNASDSSLAAILINARTKPSGSIIPGFGLPTPDATLTPPSAPIIGGGPVWAPLGGYSGACYSSGCGYTGWVHASYTINTAGSYLLQFGVTDWADQIYDSGMAFDGASIGGQLISAPVPEPETYAMLLAGLGLLGFTAKRRKQNA